MSNKANKDIKNGDLMDYQTSFRGFVTDGVRLHNVKTRDMVETRSNKKITKLDDLGKEHN